MSKTSAKSAPRIEVKKVLTKPDWLVRLDGRLVGKIVCRTGTYRYTPRGGRDGGEAFPSLDACIRSLGGGAA